MDPKVSLLTLTWFDPPSDLKLFNSTATHSEDEQKLEKASNRDFVESHYFRKSRKSL